MGVAITADKINTLVKAAGVTVEPFWPGLFAKALEGQNIGALLANAGGPSAGPLPQLAVAVLLLWKPPLRRRRKRRRQNQKKSRTMTWDSACLTRVSLQIQHYEVLSSGVTWLVTSSEGVIYHQCPITAGVVMQ